MTLVSQPSLLIKFRSGNCNGHWLLKSDIVLQNKMIKALGQQVWSLLHFFLFASFEFTYFLIFSNIFPAQGMWVAPKRDNLSIVKKCEKHAL